MKLTIIFGLLLLLVACGEPPVKESSNKSSHTLSETSTTAARKINISAHNN